jgi:hypothetical protein
MVMVRQTRKRNNWELGRTHQAILRQFQVNIEASINGGSKSLHPKIWRDITFLHPTLEHNQNSAKDVSDERAIDAFTQGLHRVDFVEEMGRIKPKNSGGTHGCSK